MVRTQSVDQFQCGRRECWLEINVPLCHMVLSRLPCCAMLGDQLYGALPPWEKHMAMSSLSLLSLSLLIAQRIFWTKKFELCRVSKKTPQDCSSSIKIMNHVGELYIWSILQALQSELKLLGSSIRGNRLEVSLVFAAVSLLLAQVYKPFSKSMLNRKMVFRVTKSQSMKDKLSFILYYMIILTGGWRVDNFFIL